MAGKIGFTTLNTDPYVYIENTVNNTASASIGINSAGTGTFDINLSSSAGAAPGTGFQPLSIDVVTGTITLTPLGGGTVDIDGPLTVSGGITFTGNLTINNQVVDTSPAILTLSKDRAGAVIVTGDGLGNVLFRGYDGTAYVSGASITSASSGTIAANRVAGNLVFATHPDSASGVNATTRMTIASTGAITVAAPDSGTALTITAGGLTVTAGSTTLSALNSVGVVQTNALGVLATSAGTNGQLLIGGTGVAPAWAAITAGAGISVTNGSNTITIAATDSVTWNTVAGTSASMAVDNGYIANNGALVTLTLPAVAAVGDQIRVTGKGAGGWLIAQNAGQTIYFGTSTTTTGAGGSLASTAQRDGVELVCVTANNDFNVISAIGNLTVV